MRNVESIEVGYGEALQFGVSQGTYYKEPEQLLTEAYEAGKREQADELEAARAELWDRTQKILQLEQQLAAEQAKSMQLREALESCGYADDSTDPEMCGPYYDAELVQQALAIQPDDAALKAWLGEPVSYLYKHASAFGYGEFWSHRQNHNGVTAIESKALYSPKLLK